MSFNKFYLLYILIIISFIVSCEKNTLESGFIDSPKLYFNASFDGAPVIYNAGDQNYYANSYRLFNNHDSLLTYTFVIDDLKNSGRRYIEISINNYRASNSDFNKEIDSAVITGSYKYSFMIPKPKNPKHFSEVKISWYNDFQEKYSSYNIEQKGSFFNITNVKDTIYTGSDGVVRLKKVTINFNCILFNPTYDDTLKVTSGIVSAIF